MRGTSYLIGGVKRHEAAIAAYIENRIILADQIGEVILLKVLLGAPYVEDTT